MLKSYPCNGLRRPIGLWDVKDPTLSRQSAHRRSAMLYQPRKIPGNYVF
jgi:hypothetical protein